jgi:hypothetical protein
MRMRPRIELLARARLPSLNCGSWYIAALVATRLRRGTLGATRINIEPCDFLGSRSEHDSEFFTNAPDAKPAKRRFYAPKLKRLPFTDPELAIHQEPSKSVPLRGRDARLGDFGRSFISFPSPDGGLLPTRWIRAPHRRLSAVRRGVRRSADW